MDAIVTMVRAKSVKMFSDPDTMLSKKRRQRMLWQKYLKKGDLLRNNFCCWMI